MAAGHHAWLWTPHRDIRRVLWQPEHFVTEDSGVVCGGGMYASIDLSLYLVEKFCGHDIALQCAKALVVSLPRNLQSGYGVIPLSRPHADERVKQAENLLQGGFNRKDLSVELVPSNSHEPRTCSSLQGRHRSCRASTFILRVTTAKGSARKRARAGKRWPRPSATRTSRPSAAFSSAIPA